MDMDSTVDWFANSLSCFPSVTYSVFDNGTTHFRDSDWLGAKSAIAWMGERDNRRVNPLSLTSPCVDCKEAKRMRAGYIHMAI